MAVRKFIFLLLWALLAGISPAALAANPDDGIFLVDMQRIINESILGKAARNNLEAEAKKRQASLGGAKAELDKMKTDLEKQASVLSAAALDERRAALEKKAREFERAVHDQREELSRKNGAEIEKLVKQINSVVRELAEKGNYKFVMEKDARVVLYADSSLDITDQVLKILDSRKVGL
jgi:outer membrane protein